MKKLRVLVACEESQTVTKEFRKLGHEAFSCDIQECSGGHPEWHIQDDVTEILKLKWDIIIAHPPCTHLAVSGSRHFIKKREDGRQREGIELFMKFLDVDCELVAVENPIGIISGNYIKEHFPDLAEKYNLPVKHSQIIQPYEYGDPFEKRTCLWLKGLPKLEATNIVEPPKRTEFASGKSMATWFADAWKLPKDERAKLRSKTFQGIAEAMASQWSSYALKN